MAATKTKVGGMPKDLYREMTRTSSIGDAPPVFDVAARSMQRKPSFNSKSYTTDDAPVSKADAAKTIVIPTTAHNMFSAPQPGSKPLTLSGKSGYFGTAKLAPSATRINAVNNQQKKLMTANTIDTPYTAATAAAITPVATTTPSAATQTSPSVTPSPTAENNVCAGTDTPVPELSSGARPRLNRQQTLNTISNAAGRKFVTITLYDGQRCVLSDVMKQMGIRVGVLPSVYVEYFDELHMEALIELDKISRSANDAQNT